jgi:hypothetical protein
VVVVLEAAGAASILAAFTLGQLRLLDQHSVVDLILNLHHLACPIPGM